jgi:eukaryotic-like serine/threonine-protein kinase
VTEEVGPTASLIADKYQLVRLLGRGGMGAVYEARHTQTRKRCAVKLLRGDELAGDAESLKRFFREARAAGLIECEHVVSALDSGIDQNGRAYYVMEYLSGEDLSQVLERVGMLTPTAAVKIAAQAARGLSSAHALQIVHRDIKPGNLFLARTQPDELKVKVLDFGVAKVKLEMFEESAGSPTQNDTLLGTLQYMSPAQLKRASAIDETADIWSLGILLYECVTGELPWRDAEGIGDLVTAILTIPVPSLLERAPWASPRLAQVVKRATARDEALRFSSARELSDELRALLGGDVTLRAAELVAPTAEERRVRHETSLPSVESDGRPTTAPLVASVRPSKRPRALTHGALAGLAAVLALSVRVFIFSTDEPAPAAPGAGVAQQQKSADLTLPQVESANDDDEPTMPAAVAAPAKSTDSSAALLRKPSPSRLERAGQFWTASRPHPTLDLPAAAATPVASSADSSTPAAPSEQTTLERYGGSDRWPKPNVAAP